jgi:hypothetical protein
LIAVSRPDSEFRSAMVCGVNRVESAGQRRRDEQQPEGNDGDDLAFR